MHMMFSKYLDLLLEKKIIHSSRIYKTLKMLITSK